MRNDIGIYFLQKSYPYIVKVENLMRKLITKFMIVSLGQNCFDESTPKEIKIKQEKEHNKNSGVSFLLKTDFIDLSTYLFKNTRLKDSEDLIKCIDRRIDLSTININDNDYQ